MLHKNKPLISIVICTYNRAAILSECIQSLIIQSAPSDIYEVVVVDNNSTDKTGETASTLINNHQNISMVHESEQGLSHARNRGWREAHSEWVAYIDDDAKAMPNYVERILHVIKNYSFDCFGGVYLPWYHYGKPKWFKDFYACASNTFVQDYTGLIDEGCFASGGNLVIKRSILEKLGGFSPDFGMSGVKLAYGEETHLQLRMKAAGLSIGFDPELRVQHLVNKYKMNPLWLLKFQYSTHRDTVIIDETMPTWRHFVDIIWNACRFATKSIIVSTYCLMRDDYYIQNWFIDIFQPLAGDLGKFIGMLTKNMHHRIKRATM